MQTAYPDAAITFPILGKDFSVDPPRYFEVFGLKVHWYGVIIALGLLLAVCYMMKNSKRFGLTDDNVLDIIICAVPIGIIGARLYYVVFNFEEYRGNILRAFEIWNGGLAIYGGIIFGALTICVYAKIKKIPLGAILDLSAFGVLIGQIMGRWGNFFNREAFGAATDLPWKMGFITQSGTVFVHPTFLYESLWNLIGLVILHIYSKKHRRYDGQIILMYLCWYGFGRAMIEGLRTDSLYLFGTGIRVSQLLGILLFAVSAVVLLLNKYKFKHDPKDLFVNKQAIKTEDAEKNIDE